MAWLSLDQGDDDGARFWRYMIAALQTVRASLGQDALQLLQAAQQAAPQALVTAMLNQVALLARQVVLVLDDYHLISETGIHEGIAYLLEHLPPTLHLVISSRADPPLPTHRLRARGQLAELRSHDLRFTADEAAALLNARMGLNLAREDMEVLEARTEGWIVGLQLAALSLQGRADAHEFISAFSGGHHYVLEYLTHEVVRWQPEPVQRFLMQTSILFARDFQRTARLIEDNALAMVRRGELATLLRWIEALPEDVAHSRPWLCVRQAWPLTLAGKADAAEPLLHQIEEQVPLDDFSAEGQEILGHVATMRAMTAMIRGDMPRAIELAHRAAALLPADNVIPRNSVL